MKLELSKATIHYESFGKGYPVGAIEQVDLCLSLINDWLDRVEEHKQV